MIFILGILWSCSSFRNYCIRSGRSGYSNFRDFCKKDKRINNGGKTSASEDTGSSEYKVCMITDAADITDQSFNQTTYEACRDYCKANIIVLPGYVFAQTVVDTSFKYPDVKFIALDMNAGDIGAAAGALKAYLNVNEVIACIMLNWISLYVVNTVLTQVKESGTTYTLPLRTNNPGVVLPSLGLNHLFSDNRYVTIAILLAVIFAILVWGLLEKTKLGYELKATGLSINAAKYAGMKEKKNIILTMVISGALGGALVMKYMPNLSPAAMVILVGAAMNMLATAAATVFVKAINMAENPNNVSSTIQYIHQKKAFSIVKIAGFEVNWFMIITIVLLIAANIVLYRTRLGLRLMACGEHPQAADSVGINVYKMLPYIIFLLVLAVSSKKSRAPKAEGIPYDKGQR